MKHIHESSYDVAFRIEGWAQSFQEKGNPGLKNLFLPKKEINHFIKCFKLEIILNFFFFWYKITYFCKKKLTLHYWKHLTTQFHINFRWWRGTLKQNQKNCLKNMQHTFRRFKHWNLFQNFIKCFCLVWLDNHLYSAQLGIKGFKITERRNNWVGSAIRVWSVIKILIPTTFVWRSLLCRIVGIVEVVSLLYSGVIGGTENVGGRKWVKVKMRIAIHIIVWKRSEFTRNFVSNTRAFKNPIYKISGKMFVRRSRVHFWNQKIKSKPKIKK